MKFALIQCDAKNGDLAGNSTRIAEFCKKASGVDLCLAPDCSLGGFQKICPADGDACLAKLASDLKNQAPLLCELSGRHFLLSQGEILPIDQGFELQGKRFALAGSALEADFILNTAPVQFKPRAIQDWELELAGLSRQTGAFSLSVNLAGGFGGEIYSGQSLAINPAGNLTARGRAFAEDLLLIDTESSSEIAPVPESVIQAQWLALKLGLADFVHKAGAKKALIGLSGGMDSALVAAIAQAALGSENVTGILMPSPYTSQESLTDASQLAQNLGIATFTIQIEPMFSAFRQGLGSAFGKIEAVEGDLTEENLQARIRGVILMAFANRTGALVLNTGNRSEALMGYSTLYGDTVGAVAVIGDLFKTEVYKLAEYVNEAAGKEVIPRNIFEKAPSAELRPNQKDTDSLPPYDELDPQLAELLANPCADVAMGARVRGAAFKRRQCPPALLVSGRPDFS